MHHSIFPPQNQGGSMFNCIKCNAALPEGALFCPSCGKKQVSEKKPTTRRGNGTGSVYKRGKTWEAAVVLGYKLEDGKAIPIRCTKGGFKTKREAIEYLPTLKQERPKTIPTIYDLWQRYRSSHQFEKLSASRKEKYSIVWRKIEKESFISIDALTVSDLQRIVDTYAKTFYPARDIKDLLSKLYQLALPDRYVQINLAEYIELPPLNAKEREAFSQEDVTNLWNDYLAGNWWTGYILLMIYTGMMPGELMCALQSQIDWAGKSIVGAGKKTKERKETPIVLADIILPVLADLCDHTPGNKLIAINKDNFYTKYYQTLDRVGCKRLTPYSCRHSTATALALENIPSSVIQKVMRHARFSTTEQYIHVSLEPMLDAINKLPKPE